MRQLVLQLEEHEDQEGKFWQGVLASGTLMKDYDVVISHKRGGNQTLITNLTGHPAISVPAGFDEKGSPTSIILVGNLYDEASILALANHFQDATDFHNKRPPLLDKPVETPN